MKICNICNEEKENNLFPCFGGLKCKKCLNKIRVKQNQNREIKYRDASNAFIIELKSKPCIDCGKSFHYSAMDFDHRDPSSKHKPISKMKMASQKTILKEIELCDLLCAVCHRNRTQNQVKNEIFNKPRIVYKDKPIIGTVTLAIENEPSKICAKCKRNLHIKSFVKWSRGKDGLKTQCRECRNIVSFNRRRKNPEKFATNRRERYDNNSEFINSLKDNKSCVDCGEIFRYWCLDYDHKEGSEKSNVVSKLKGSGFSLKTILKEIELCDLVCVCCHRIRTFNRKQHNTNPRKTSSSL